MGYQGGKVGIGHCFNETAADNLKAAIIKAIEDLTGKVYQGENYSDTHPIEYFLRGKERRVVHQKTSDLLEEWLLMLKEKGEDVIFTGDAINKHKDYLLEHLPNAIFAPNHLNYTTAIF